MTLTRAYTRAVIYPSILVLILFPVYSIYDNNEYQSEWFTREKATQLEITVGVIYVSMICILSLTIFLNRYPQVSENLFWRTLSWFLLPSGFIGVILFRNIKFYIDYTVSIKEMVPVLILHLPFLVSLPWTFIAYNKKRQEAAIQ